MNNTCDTANKDSRPILSIARSPSLSAEDFEAIERTLARGAGDLSQASLEDLLQRFAQNREQRRLIHIDIALCAVKDCFAAVKNGQVDAREKAFRDAPKGESTGHYFYRFFVVNCGFSKSKATKISTYLERPVREGLSPADIRKQMIKNWTLEEGYNEVLRARDESEADGHDGEETGNPDEPGAKRSKKGRRATKPQDSSGSDDPPKPPRSGTKPPADEQEDEPHQDKEPKTTKRATRPVKIVGKPDPLAAYDNEALARIRYGKNGQPRRIKYLSARRASEEAEHQLQVLARRKVRRMIREQRLDS